MPAPLTRQQLADRCIADQQRLRLLRRDLKKLVKRAERTITEAYAPIRTGPAWLPPDEPLPPEPRWLLTSAQLRYIAAHIDLSVAGTYADMGAALRIDGDLYAMLEETFRAAGCPGTRHTWLAGEARHRWLLSYTNAKAAYAWHLAVADDRATMTATEKSKET